MNSNYKQSITLVSRLILFILLAVFLFNFNVDAASAAENSVEVSTLVVEMDDAELTGTESVPVMASIEDGQKDGFVFNLDEIIKKILKKLDEWTTVYKRGYAWSD